MNDFFLFAGLPFVPQERLFVQRERTVVNHATIGEPLIFEKRLPVFLLIARIKIKIKDGID